MRKYNTLNTVKYFTWGRNTFINTFQQRAYEATVKLSV